MSQARPLCSTASIASRLVLDLAYPKCLVLQNKNSLPFKPALVASCDTLKDCHYNYTYLHRQKCYAGRWSFIWDPAIISYAAELIHLEYKQGRHLFEVGFHLRKYAIHPAYTTVLSRYSGVKSLQMPFSLNTTLKARLHFKWRLRKDMLGENNTSRPFYYFWNLALFF